MSHENGSLPADGASAPKTDSPLGRPRLRLAATIAVEGAFLAYVVLFVWPFVAAMSAANPDPSDVHELAGATILKAHASDHGLLLNLADGRTVRIRNTPAFDIEVEFPSKSK